VTAAPDHAQWEELAALDSLGMLEGDEAAAWAAHQNTCEPCRLERLALADVSGDLALAASPAAPPASLRQRLLDGLEANSAVQRRVVRAEGGWQPTRFPGVDAKRLSMDPATGDITSLVRMAPGAVYAPHRHASSEHCYVVEGDLVFADHTLSAGDYSVSAPQTEHSQATSANGCLLLIIHNVHDEMLASR
jgi:anti-sigma factor ChrR (cupin superfamily)